MVIPFWSRQEAGKSTIFISCLCDVYSVSAEKRNVFRAKKVTLPDGDALSGSGKARAEKAHLQCRAFR